MKKIKSLLCLGIYIYSGNILYAQTSLNSLIPTLYGNDGVQLMEATSGFSHAPHFIDDSLVKLNNLSRAAEEVNITIPSTGSGLHFVMDEISGDFISTSSPQGGTFSEYGATIGKGQLNFGLSYTYTNYTHYEGQNLDNVSLDLTHLDLRDPGVDFCISGPPGECYEFERDVVRVNTSIDIKSHVLMMYGSYGITDKMEVSILAPLMKTSLNANATAQVVEHESAEHFEGTLHQFDPLGLNGDSSFSSVSGSHVGFGDIYARAKYQLVDRQALKISTLLDLRLPTGSANNLQGINKIGLRPMIAASYDIPFSSGGIALHTNIGYEINSGSLGQNEVDYLFGTEFYFLWDNNMLSLTADIIGSQEVTHKDEIGDKNNDLALGIKWKSENEFYLYYGLKIALDKEGLRAATVHSFGLQVVY